MDADVVVAAGCAFDVVAVADEAFGPFEVDVFDCLAGFLAHDVGEGGCGGGDVGDGEVLLHAVACEEEGEVVDLGEWILNVAWWDG